MELSDRKRVLELYDLLGVNVSTTFAGVDPADVFSVLGIKPTVNSQGRRMLTPYEILGVPPQFVGGKERPIVFAIKNRVKKIGHLEMPGLFLFKSKRVKEEDSLLEQLSAKYRHAIFEGNDADAASFLDMINNLSRNKADELMDSFYNYTKFYKKMKKQLLIDIFAHFFLMYINSSDVNFKKGIIKGGKVYRAYKEGSNENIKEEQVIGFGFGKDFDMPNLKSITIERPESEDIDESYDDYRRKSRSSSDVSMLLKNIEARQHEEKAKIEKEIRQQMIDQAEADRLEFEEILRASEEDFIDEKEVGEFFSDESLKKEQDPMIDIEFFEKNFEELNRMRQFGFENIDADFIPDIEKLPAMKEAENSKKLSLEEKGKYYE